MVLTDLAVIHDALKKVCSVSGYTYRRVDLPFETPRLAGLIALFTEHFIDLLQETFINPLQSLSNKGLLSLEVFFDEEGQVSEVTKPEDKQIIMMYKLKLDDYQIVSLNYIFTLTACYGKYSSKATEQQTRAYATFKDYSSEFVNRMHTIVAY